MENKDGQIAKGTTVPFQLKKGTNILKIKDIPKTNYKRRKQYTYFKCEIKKN